MTIALVLVLLSGCNALPDGTGKGSCAYDEALQVIRVNFSLNANGNVTPVTVPATGTTPDPNALANNEGAVGQWYNTNVNIPSGAATAQVNVSGRISLCSAETKSYNFPVLAKQSNTWKGPSQTITQNPNHDLDNDTITGQDVTVYEGDIVKVVVGAPGPNNIPCDRSTTNENDSVSQDALQQNQWTNNKGSCAIKNGVGLLGRIGGSNTAQLGLGEPNPGNIWGGKGDIPASYETMPTDGSDPNSLPNGGYYGMLKSGVGGPLQFKIDDCHTMAGCRHDNLGGYNLTVTHTSSGCPAEDGRPFAPMAPSGQVEALLLAPGTTPDNATQGALIDAGANNNLKGKGSGVLWLRVRDSVYTNNSGQYDIEVTAEKSGNTISEMIMGFVNPLKETLDAAVKQIYNNLVANTNFIQAVRAACILYIMIYGVMFIYGMVPMSQLDFTIRLVKMAVVLSLLSNKSWEYFNTYFFTLFKEGSMSVLSAMTGNLGTSDNPFRFVDSTVGYLFSGTTFKKIIGMLLAFPVGWIFCGLIFYGAWVYLKAIAKALIGYIMGMIAVSLLLTMAPIFLTFLLFNVTRSLFDSWVKMLFRYALEPTLMLGTLALLNEFLVMALHGALGYGVCWKCALPIKIPMLSYITGGTDSLLCIYGWLPWGFDNQTYNDNLPWAITNILFFIIIVKLIDVWADFLPRIAASLTTTSAITGSNIYGYVANFTGPAKHANEAISSGFKKLTGQDVDSKVRRKKASDAAAKAEKEAKTANAAAGGLGDGLDASGVSSLAVGALAGGNSQGANVSNAEAAALKDAAEKKHAPDGGKTPPPLPPRKGKTPPPLPPRAGKSGAFSNLTGGNLSENQVDEAKAGAAARHAAPESGAETKVMPLTQEKLAKHVEEQEKIAKAEASKTTPRDNDAVSNAALSNEAKTSEVSQAQKLSKAKKDEEKKAEEEQPTEEKSGTVNRDAILQQDARNAQARAEQERQQEAREREVRQREEAERKRLEETEAERLRREEEERRQREEEERLRREEEERRQREAGKNTTPPAGPNDRKS